MPTLHRQGTQFEKIISNLVWAVGPLGRWAVVACGLLLSAPQAHAGQWQVKLEYDQASSITSGTTTPFTNQGWLGYDNTSGPFGPGSWGNQSFSYMSSLTGVAQNGVSVALDQTVAYTIRLRYIPNANDPNDVPPQLVALQLQGVAGGHYAPPPSGYTGGTGSITGSTGLGAASPVISNNRGVTVDINGTMRVTVPNPTRETDLTIGPLSASARGWLPNAYQVVIDDSRGGSTVTQRYAMQDIAIRNALSGTLSSYGVYISSDIEASWRKDTGPLPTGVYQKKNAAGEYINARLVSDNGTPSNLTDDIWALKCLRNLNGSIDVHSAQSKSVFNGQWVGFHSLQANSIGFPANTSYDWTYQGPGDNYDAPFGDRLSWDTSDSSTARLRLAFGATAPAQKSGTVKVFVLDPSLPALFNTYDILWHLPLENFRPQPVKRDYHIEIFRPDSVTSGPVAEDGIISGEFIWNDSIRVGDVLDGVATGLELASAFPFDGNAPWGLLLAGLGMVASDAAQNSHEGSVSFVNSIGRWNESLFIQNRGLLDCVPPNKTHAQCKMVEPLVVVHYDGYPYLCESYGNNGYEGDITKIKLSGAQSGALRYAGIYEYSGDDTLPGDE